VRADGIAVHIQLYMWVVQYVGIEAAMAWIHDS